MAPRDIKKLTKKANYLDQLKQLLGSVPDVMIIHADNVGSKQFQEIRLALRGKATVVMGKNTMIRTALRQYQEENPESDITPLMNIVRGNIGFIFCNEDIGTIREIVSSNKVPAAAKVGAIAPIDVHIPAGPTGLDPSQTNFFQALNIATKIVKGSVEIVSDVHLCQVGTKVSASQAALLQKLNIRPFAYGLEVKYICQNLEVFDAAVMDITDDDIVQKFMAGVANVAAFSREIGVPTEASLPHMVVSAFKNIAALCADLDFTFPEIETIKEYLKDPSKFAVASAGATGAAAPAAEAAPAAAVVEEEEDEDMGFDLFD